jgi:hypothetical protein
MKLLLVIVILLCCTGCGLLMATPKGFYDSRGNYSGCSYPCYISTKDGKHHYTFEVDNPISVKED